MFKFVTSDQYKLVRTMWNAVRPWSFAMSLIPVLIISAAIPQQSPSATTVSSFIKLNCVALSLLCTHCGSNLTNTYFDYVNGIDTRATSHAHDKDSHPDPTLVHKLLLRREVKAMSITAYAIGASITCAMLLLDTHFTFVTPIHSAIPTASLLYLLGSLLGYFYTANPISFKYHGLGELVVFICFGIFLIQYVGLMLFHTVPVQLYLYTLPLTLLTIAILHTNNTRDVHTDRNANTTATASSGGGGGGMSNDSGRIITIAGQIGQERSFQLYQSLVILSYVMLSVVVIAYQRYTCLLTLCTLPWAWRLIEEFRHEKYAIVMKGTTKLYLVVGIVYYVGLVTSL